MFKSILFNSFSTFLNEKGRIDCDIKVHCKGNAVHVEKWNQVKCLSRFIIAYASTANSSDRDISNP